MKLTIAIVLFGACVSPIPDAPEDVLGTPIAPDTVSVPPTPLTCVPGTPENLAVFGDGSDGDFIVPAGAQITLSRDMNWHNLSFQDGSSFILTNGWAVHVSGTLSGPPSFGVASFRMNGRDASGAIPGAGYPAGGSIMLGGSGTGGIPGDQGTTSLPGIWMSVLHPGAGGSGGGANGGASVPGWTGPIAPFGLITDGLPAARMTLGDGTPLAGGAGGAGGTGGGAGGGGAGNVSVAAAQIANAGRVFLQARGGAGGNATSGNGGGGGGGSGGYVTIVTGEGSPFPVVDITGGVGGHSFGTANNGGSGGDGSVLPYCVGSEVQDMVLEVFGNGSDGDFTIPPGTTFVMTRDMFWRNLTFPDGVSSTIDPNGFVIHVSDTLTAPTPIVGTFPTHAFISRNGADAVNSTPGVGYACSGTLNGGSGTGGISGSSVGLSGTLPSTGGAFSNAWPDTWHPGLPGNGGTGNGSPGTGGTGTGPTVLSPSAGSPDLFSAIRLRFLDMVTPYMGGAGGAGGGPNASAAAGGAGGAGGGNIVVIAKTIVNPGRLIVQSGGGNGGDSLVSGGGGGGGGSGGFIAFVTYRRASDVTFAVSGGQPGFGIGPGTFGQSGGNGIVLPFSFVINS